VKRIVSIFAVTLFASGLGAQEKKPWEVDRLCGKLEHVQKIPDRKNTNSLSEKRKTLREVRLGIYERHENQVCCEGVNAVETTQTGRGGRFEFKTKKRGDFWIATNWSGKQYKLAVVYKPGKSSATMCSQQGIGLDDEGDAEWWAIVTVD
jgi:hypothetical protein